MGIEFQNVAEVKLPEPRRSRPRLIIEVRRYCYDIVVLVQQSVQVMHAVWFENNVVVEDQKVLTTRYLYRRHALANSIWRVNGDVLHNQPFAKPLRVCNYSCGLEITARIGNDDFVYRVSLDRERFQ